MVETVEELRAKLRAMHRRAQAAEGKVERAKVWLGFHEEKSALRTPYVHREMALYYLRRIRREFER